MEELIQNLKHEIIESLNLEDMEANQIGTDMPLFVEGLGLDSIDALELIVLLEKKYGLKIDTAEEGKRILHSIRTMAEHIVRHRNK